MPRQAKNFDENILKAKSELFRKIRVQILSFCTRDNIVHKFMLLFPRFPENPGIGYRLLSYTIYTPGLFVPEYMKCCGRR